VIIIVSHPIAFKGLPKLNGDGAAKNDAHQPAEKKRQPNSQSLYR